MHLILTALGSYGDVLPMAGLGAAMRARGHDVEVVANPYFAPVLEAAGVDILPIGTVEEYHELTSDPDLWHPLRGPAFVLRANGAHLVRPLYELLDTKLRPGRTLLGAHTLDLASRVLQLEGRAPMATVFYAPISLRSMHRSPQMFGMLMSERTPRWLRRAQFWLADKLIVDRLLGPAVNGLLAEKGLPAASRILGDWFLSPELVVGMYPEWFAPTQPDWPASYTATGFPLWDRVGDDPAGGRLDERVEAFLAAGERPVVFAPGSAMTRSADFFHAAAEACRRLGRRGLLVSKYPDQIPDPLPEGVAHFDYVPFSTLLPRAAALVHHGGIGTCSQGLAAGVRHLVTPIAFDQFDNASRLVELGVARVLRWGRVDADRLYRLLDDLLSDDEAGETAERLAERADGGNGLGKTCEALEHLGRKHGLR
ncbi:MAG: nucleotide disphospho-sugar-binding domain-containing protein [Planctomycetota bacterium]